MLHLGSIRGTSIDVDLSFIILIVFFVATNYDASAGIQYALLWAPVILVSVLVHELAHAAMIGAFGYGASAIVLGGMGGVTVNRRVARPWHDMVISLAGPISSFILAALFWWLRMVVPFFQRDPMFLPLTAYLVLANVFWGIFNLVPISPLDGGHAVRNFLRMFLDERRAFAIAVWIGMIAGTAVALWEARQGSYFIAVFLGWMVFMNFQSWQYFREHGIPGD